MVSLEEAALQINEVLADILSYCPNRLSLTQFLASTFEEIEDRVPHRAIRVTTGVGKTELVLQKLGPWIADRKIRGLPHRVLFLVPNHKLGTEMLERAGAFALGAAVFRGRNASQPGFKAKPMCADLNAVRDGLRVGADISAQICGTGNPKERSCPFRLECPWWSQINEAEEADVLICAHEFLFYGLPRKVGDGFGLVVIDESFWQRGLKLREAAGNSAFNVEGFASAVNLTPGRLDADAVSRLEEISIKAEIGLRHAWKSERKLAFAVSRVPGETPLAAEAVRRAGLTLAEVREALKLEDRRGVKVKIRPGMSPLERIRLMQSAGVNVEVKLRKDFWLALYEMLKFELSGTGHIIVKKDGERLVAEVSGRQRLRPGLLGLPIIHLDATMQIELVRYFLRRIKLAADLDVAAPFQHIVQVRGRRASGTRREGNWALQYLSPSKAKDPDEQRRRADRLRKVETFCVVRGAALVTHKDLLRDMPRLAPEKTANFNATLGLDRLGSERELVVVGRPLPAPQDLLGLARAVTGKPIPACAAEANWSDGKLFYPDATLHLVRLAITEAEVLQAIGRARGVQRKASNPVTVWVFISDMELPIKIDEVVHWDDIEPGLAEEMMAEGLVLESAADIVRVFPELVKGEDGAVLSEAAVRKRLSRARSVAIGRGGGWGDHRDIPLLDIPIGGCHDDRMPGIGDEWRRIVYRPTGHGQKTRRGFVRTDRVERLRSDLENVLSQLVLLEFRQLSND